MGDSNDNLLAFEGEDRGDDASPVTSQDLLRLRRLERQRQHAPQVEQDALPEEDQPTEEFYPLPPSAAPPSPPRFAPAPTLRRPAAFPPPPPQHFAPGAARSPALSDVPMTGWRSVRMHSHWLIPVALVVVFFFLMLFTHPQQAVAMLFIFAAIGLIQAALLLYAPNDAFWAVAVVGGFVVMVSAVFFVLFLPIFAVILSILLLSLGGVALRERYYPVKEGTVVVMGLFGRYNRTLQPGFNLRVPGEKVLGVVETQNIRYEARMPPIMLVSGEQVTLSVAITYQVVPGEEHLAIRLTKDWQRPIQQHLRAVVQDEISLLSIQDFQVPGGVAAPRGTSGGYNADERDNEQAGSPLERINERLTNAMRMKVADRGVAVHEVKVHLLDSPHLLGSAPAPVHQAPPVHPAPMPHSTIALPMPQNEGQVVEGTVQNAAMDSPALYPGDPFGMAGQPLPPIHPAGPPAAPPPAELGTPPAGAPQPPMTLLSAQALAETYDAVVRHRISDMATIQRIISQFEAVAADPELSQQVPFDAAAGALNLINHLHHLQMRSLAQLGQQQNNDTSSPPNAPAGQDEQH
ncbi:MAG TPA: SPFH domain-containing protein [Ktedonobacterales bacterium]|nr:SPFH domain-containing protein [Ktedonobacterales bacterium]